MKIYRLKKELPISALILLIFFMVLDCYQPTSGSIAVEIIAKLMLLSVIIVPFFYKVIIDDHCIEVKYPFITKKLLWSEIVEIKNHPWIQSLLKLIPSPESGKKEITIQFTMLEGNVLNDIAEHVDSNKVKCTLFLEKD